MHYTKAISLKLKLRGRIALYIYIYIPYAALIMLAKFRTMTIEQRADSAKSTMDVLCKSYSDNADAAIVELTKTGQQCLVECGLALYEQVHSNQTVTHPWNRGHDLLEPADVPEKIAEISDIGWDVHKVADASGVRMPHDSTLRRAIELANSQLADASDGVLPPVVPGTAVIAVTACSHTTAGLKCANFGTKCEIGRISEGGTMSKAAIVGRQPTMADPIEKGMRYFVVEYIVQELWPAYVEMTIEAANASNQLAKPDTPLQLMLKVHKFMLDAAKKGEPIDAGTIHRKILRTKPSNPEDMKALIAYAINWSGGDDPIFLRRFQKYTKLLRVVNRLKGSIVSDLSDIDMGKGSGARYRCAALMCIATHDNLTSMHVKSLGKKKDIALLAEKQMIAFDAALQELLSSSGVGAEYDPIITLKSAEHDQQCVFFVHSIVKKFNTLRDIAATHFADVAIVVGQAGVTNPFTVVRTDKGPVLKKAKVADTAVGSQHMQQLTEASTFTDAGKTLRTLIDTAFMSKGGTIRPKSDKDVKFYIQSLDDGNANATLVQKGAEEQPPITVTYQAICGEYILFIDKEVHSLTQSSNCIGSYTSFVDNASECIVRAGVKNRCGLGVCLRLYR